MAMRGKSMTVSQLKAEVARIQNKFFFVRLDDVCDVDGGRGAAGGVSAWGCQRINDWLTRFELERTERLARLVHKMLLRCEEEMSRKYALEVLTLDKRDYPRKLRFDLPRNKKGVAR